MLHETIQKKIKLNIKVAINNKNNKNSKWLNKIIHRDLKKVLMNRGLMKAKESMWKIGNVEIFDNVKIRHFASAQITHNYYK